MYKEVQFVVFGHSSRSTVKDDFVLDYMSSLGVKGKCAKIILYSTFAVITVTSICVHGMYGKALYDILYNCVVALPLSCVVIHLWHRKYDNDVEAFINNYEHNIIQPVLDKYMHSATFELGKHVNTGELFEARLIRKGNIIEGTSLVKCRKPCLSGVLGFVESNLRVRYKSDDTKITYFYGQAYKVKLTKAVSGTVRIVTSHMGLLGDERVVGWAPKASDEYKVDIASIAFNDTFEVFASNELLAFEVLTPTVILNLLNLVEEYESFGIVLTGEYMYFGVNTCHKLLYNCFNKDSAVRESMDAQDIESLLQTVKDFTKALEI